MLYRIKLNDVLLPKNHKYELVSTSKIDIPREDYVKSHSCSGVTEGSILGPL